MKMLKGAALMTRARELNIPGRSRMTADDLRAAIDAISGPVPAPAVPPVPLVPFRARNGKHKRSIARPGRNSRRK